VFRVGPPDRSSLFCCGLKVLPYRDGQRVIHGYPVLDGPPVDFDPRHGLLTGLGVPVGAQSQLSNEG